MSTFSAPFLSSTFMLQAVSRSRAASATAVRMNLPAGIRPRASAMLGLEFGMHCLLGRSSRAVHAGATLSDTGYAHRQATANGNFTKQCLNGADLRDRGIGKGAQVIGDAGKITSEVRIAHGDHHRLFGRALQHLAQKLAAGVAERD